jgi:hypothetical protein
MLHELQVTKNDLFAKFQVELQAHQQDVLEKSMALVRQTMEPTVQQMNREVTAAKNQITKMSGQNVEMVKQLDEAKDAYELLSAEVSESTARTSLELTKLQTVAKDVNDAKSAYLSLVEELNEFAELTKTQVQAVQTKADKQQKALVKHVQDVKQASEESKSRLQMITQEIEDFRQHTKSSVQTVQNQAKSIWNEMAAKEQAQVTKMEELMASLTEEFKEHEVKFRYLYDNFNTEVTKFNSEIRKLQNDLDTKADDAALHGVTKDLSQLLQMVTQLTQTMTPQTMPQPGAGVPFAFPPPPPIIPSSEPYKFGIGMPSASDPKFGIGMPTPSDQPTSSTHISAHTQAGAQMKNIKGALKDLPKYREGGDLLIKKWIRMLEDVYQVFNVTDDLVKIQGLVMSCEANVRDVVMDIRDQHTDYPSFRAAVIHRYSRPGEEATLTRRVFEVKQSWYTTFRAFEREFRRMVQESGYRGPQWEQLMITQFVEALSNEVCKAHFRVKIEEDKHLPNFNLSAYVEKVAMWMNAHGLESSEQLYCDQRKHTGYVGPTGPSGSQPTPGPSAGNKPSEATPMMLDMLQQLKEVQQAVTRLHQEQLHAFPDRQQNATPSNTDWHRDAVCYRCNRKGHIAVNCRVPRESQPRDAQQSQRTPSQGKDSRGRQRERSADRNRSSSKDRRPPTPSPRRQSKDRDKGGRKSNSRSPSRRSKSPRK